MWTDVLRGPKVFSYKMTLKSSTIKILWTILFNCRSISHSRSLILLVLTTIYLWLNLAEEFANNMCYSKILSSIYLLAFSSPRPFCLPLLPLSREISTPSLTECHIQTLKPCTPEYPRYQGSSQSTQICLSVLLWPRWLCSESPATGKDKEQRL